MPDHGASIDGLNRCSIVHSLLRYPLARPLEGNEVNVWRWTGTMPPLRRLARTDEIGSGGRLAAVTARSK